jgi:hypothetical protein
MRRIIQDGRIGGLSCTIWQELLALIKKIYILILMNYLFKDCDGLIIILQKYFKVISFFFLYSTSFEGANKIQVTTIIKNLWKMKKIKKLFFFLFFGAPMSYQHRTIKLPCFHRTIIKYKRPYMKLWKAV